MTQMLWIDDVQVFRILQLWSHHRRPPVLVYVAQEHNLQTESGFLRGVMRATSADPVAGNFVVGKAAVAKNALRLCQDF